MVIFGYIIFYYNKASLIGAVGYSLGAGIMLMVLLGTHLIDPILISFDIMKRYLKEKDNPY